MTTVIVAAAPLEQWSVCEDSLFVFMSASYCKVLSAPLCRWAPVTSHRASNMSILFCVTVLKCVSASGDEVTSHEPDEPAENEDSSGAEMKLQCGDKWRLWWNCAALMCPARWRSRWRAGRFQLLNWQLWAAGSHRVSPQHHKFNSNSWPHVTRFPSFLSLSYRHVAHAKCLHTICHHEQSQ